HELAERRASVLPATNGSGVAVLVRQVDDMLHARLHADGCCQGCFWHSDSDSPGPSGRGMYDYTHLYENWAPRPYRRITLPQRPVHIDELPPDLRQLIAQMRFEGLSFAQTPHINPEEHAPCDSW